MNITVQKAEDSDCEQWTAFVADHPCSSPLHHWAWRQILRESFSVTPYFQIARSTAGDIIGINPSYYGHSIFKGRYLTTLEDGFLTQVDAADIALTENSLEISNRLKCRHFNLRSASPAAPSPTSILKTVHSDVDLTHSAEEQWQSLGKKVRWAVRQAEKAEIEIKCNVLLDQCMDFYPVYARRMRELGTPVVSPVFFQSMAKHLGPKNMFLHLARHQGAVIGGMIIVTSGNRWTNLIAAADITQTNKHVNYLLYWKAIEHATKYGASHLSLGRSSLHSGTHNFKQKWRPIDRHLQHNIYGLSSQNHQTDGFASRVWRQLPLWLCNSLGPQLRRQLPFA